LREERQSSRSLLESLNDFFLEEGEPGSLARRLHLLPLQFEALLRSLVVFEDLVDGEARRLALEHEVLPHLQAHLKRTQLKAQVGKDRHQRALSFVHQVERVQDVTLIRGEELGPVTELGVQLAQLAHESDGLRDLN